MAVSRREILGDSAGSFRNASTALSGITNEPKFLKQKGQSYEAERRII